MSIFASVSLVFSPQGIQTYSVKIFGGVRVTCRQAKLPCDTYWYGLCTCTLSELLLQDDLSRQRKQYPPRGTEPSKVRIGVVDNC